MFGVGCLVLSFLLLLGVYAYFKWSVYRYWKNRKVDFAEPSFPFGNMRDGVTKMSFGEVMKKLYDGGKGRDCLGFWILHRPALLVRHPELVKRILVKDFDYFRDRAVHVDEELDPLSGHLFALKGSKWKNLRAKLTPTFTSGKMKMMFPIISELSGQMINHLEEVRLERGDVEIGEIHARFTTDVISACAFGITGNSIGRVGESEFRKMGRRIFQSSFWSSVRIAVLFMLPRLAAALRLRIIPEDVSDFFTEAVRETIHLRETCGVFRNDFMQLLIQLKNGGTVSEFGKEAEGDGSRQHDEGLSLGQVAAQAFVFFMAGFETSSTTLTWAVHELSQDPELQEKLRLEMTEAVQQHGGELTYEAVQDMHLLDRVVSETLRKYPPIAALNRQCTADYRIPGTDIVIERGTLVVTSVLGLHRDEEIYPNPGKFDPERFSDEAKQKRHRLTYMPFGEGPRVCIGLRFGLMQVKLGLIRLVTNFRFRPSSKTKAPMTFDRNSIVMTPEGGVWVRLLPVRG